MNKKKNRHTTHNTAIKEINDLLQISRHLSVPVIYLQRGSHFGLLVYQNLVFF